MIDMVARIFSKKLTSKMICNSVTRSGFQSDGIQIWINGTIREHRIIMMRLQDA